MFKINSYIVYNQFFKHEIQNKLTFSTQVQAKTILLFMSNFENIFYFVKYL